MAELQYRYKNIDVKTAVVNANDNSAKFTVPPGATFKLTFYEVISVYNIAVGKLLRKHVLELEEATGGGAIAVPSDQLFDNYTDRDEFFVEHPDRLEEGAYCVVNGVLEQYINGEWVDMSAAIQGTTGDPGVGVDSIEVDEENHLIVTYSNGTVQDAGLIISGSDFLGDMHGQKIYDLGMPTEDTDAASVQYVKGIASSVKTTYVQVNPSYTGPNPTGSIFAPYPDYALVDAFADEAIAPGELGWIITRKFLAADTSGFTTFDTLYLDVNGGYTNSITGLDYIIPCRVCVEGRCLRAHIVVRHYKPHRFWPGF